MATNPVPAILQCRKCGMSKPEDDFPRYRNRHSGQLAGRRKECRKCAVRRSQEAEQIALEKALAAQDWGRWPHVDTDTYIRAFSCRHVLANRFGLTPERYCDLANAQSNKCGICQRPKEGRNLAVDHCHNTGRVRGLLCEACNMSLGHIGDTIAAVERALDYLKRAESN